MMKKDGVLRNFFYNRTTGPGIWKWDHYFEIYERHFYKFRDTSVNVAEIGIYSGGSLDMWQYYFGHNARIVGIDIEPDCAIYERDGVSVYIGDQGDRAFWKMFRESEPNIDILIDDGSHKRKHQLITFNEMWSHIRAGGVYLCEDIHGYPTSDFSEFMSSIANRLHIHTNYKRHLGDFEKRLTNKTVDFQRDVKSVSFYPYVCVVEKNDTLVEEFVAPKMGDQWQPFIP